MSIFSALTRFFRAVYLRPDPDTPWHSTPEAIRERREVWEGMQRKLDAETVKPDSWAGRMRDMYGKP